MMEPPEKIKGNEEKMKKWKPRVKRDIDWGGVLNAGGGQVGSVVGGATAPRPRSADGEEDAAGGEDTGQEPEFLTVGLIGELIFSILRGQCVDNQGNGFRSTKCGEVVFVECSIWYAQSQSVQNTRKGQSTL